MAPPQKGKVGTKGAKQIVEENISTLKFYRNMALVANALGLVITFFYSSTATIILYLFSCLIYIASYQFMTFMSKATYSETGQLLDSGIDLNLEGGITEHIKDIIILTSGCQLLALISTYFWWLWMFAPIRGFMILWKNILGPYFFQSAPEAPEVNEKKQKKMERRMKRMQHMH
ncbi:PREDICTED: transmembrane protein 208 [Nicrophorus vespilloides]|uniref:Transmembrane protein 208 n=1 Tax=Nicrophorus vespilloides TaxID=110193 RepID=A0ABM1MK41_NICVS|nr:PREDICTED: transmembrane protein 208 [Nicrophorus vespilloides]